MGPVSARHRISFIHSPREVLLEILRTLSRHALEHWTEVADRHYAPVVSGENVVDVLHVVCCKWMVKATWTQSPPTWNTLLYFDDHTRTFMERKRITTR